METVQVEVWVLVDEDGDYEVGHDPETVATRYAEDGGADDTMSKRLIKITLTVPKPVPVELVATVPAEPTTGEIKVA